MKKASPLNGLAYALNSASSSRSPEQTRTLMAMLGCVMSKDWRKHGVSPGVVAEVLLNGKDAAEIASQLHLEKRQVDSMLFRADSILRGGEFFDVLFHYLSGDADSALLGMKGMGYSSHRLLPVELYDHFQACPGQYELDDCAAELEYLSSISLSRLRNPVGVDRNKVSFLLYLLSSQDPVLCVERFRIAQRLGEAGGLSGWDSQSNLAALE